MERKLADKWIAALRSGEYRQTTEVLKEQSEDGGHKHCCLGVLCEIDGSMDDYIGQGSPKYRNGPVWNEELAPTHAMALGFGPHEQNYFVDLNDKAGLDFEEIADVVDGWVRGEIVISNKPDYL